MSSWNFNTELGVEEELYFFTVFVLVHAKQLKHFASFKDSIIGVVNENYAVFPST